MKKALVVLLFMALGLSLAVASENMKTGMTRRREDFRRWSVVLRSWRSRWRL